MATRVGNQGLKSHLPAPRHRRSPGPAVSSRPGALLRRVAEGLQLELHDPAGRVVQGEVQLLRFLRAGQAESALLASVAASGGAELTRARLGDLPSRGRRLERRRE